MKPTCRSVLPLLLAAGLTAQEGTSTAGHARTRELAELGRLPTPTEVAVADIVNYHRHRLPLPRAGELVAMDVRFGAATVHPGGEAILQIGFTTAPSDDRADLPPLNLALVIDCSGSMAAAGKMEQVQQGLRAFARRLRADDRVAIVTYASEAALQVPGRRVGDGRWLEQAIDGLRTGGSTNLHGGLMLGLREVAGHLLPRGSNRVLLLTDGIANVGVTDPEAILRDAGTFTAEDVDLTTIGVGQELNTELLDRLARGGRGLFHFVADSKDVSKVFVDEVEGLVAPVARRIALRLSLPRELEIVQVYGHDARQDGDRVAVALPDMNRGVTAVVLVRCRCRRRAEPGDVLAVRADLTATAAAGERRIDLDGVARLEVVDGRTDPLADVEVKKNHTIAVLAQGMHDMAEAAAARHWTAAEAVLQDALEVARERLPNAEDPDYRAVLEMAEGHARTLRRWVDRFRDL